MRDPHSQLDSCLFPPPLDSPFTPLPPRSAHNPGLSLNILRSFENGICVLLNAPQVLEAHSLQGEVLIAFKGPLLR